MLSTPPHLPLQAPPSDLENRKGSHGKLHPVLGELVADLKYKRVYVTSAEALTKAPVWEKAKTLVPLRTTEIAEAKCLKNKVVSIILILILLQADWLTNLAKQVMIATTGHLMYWCRPNLGSYRRLFS